MTWAAWTSPVLIVALFTGSQKSFLPVRSARQSLECAALKARSSFWPLKPRQNLFDGSSPLGAVDEDHSVNQGRGPPVFRICGELHHRSGALVPTGTHPASHAQLYIYRGLLSYHRKASESPTPTPTTPTPAKANRVAKRKRLESESSADSDLFNDENMSPSRNSR